ncbi:protein of unassigned function [Methylobacterium oryzae CBMB20]|uniref:Protein of unassigned function n=1 Tax=Methylobacterium oryzae CBMB20 TaxID=693986 RepID=A0A089P662_9HYPH|nr:protein of unassigned function [Methylobacterium oryzae CBMB20]
MGWIARIREPTKPRPDSGRGFVLFRRPPLGLGCAALTPR